MEELGKMREILGTESIRETISAAFRGAHGAVEQHLVHMQVRLPVAVVVLRNGVGAPQRALDVTPVGYPQHPFCTVHAKIIFLMKANGVLDFDINELGCTSRDLGTLLWTAKISPPVFRDAADRLASPKRYGALTGSPPSTGPRRAIRYHQ
jgi:hypothetical protein